MEPGARPPSTGGIETQAMRRAVEARLFGDAPEPVRLGRFVLGERIGHGGMGVVYRGHDPQLDREVAIKVVRRTPGASSGADHERMLKEARALARLNHPNVVSVLDVGPTDAGVYIAMELVVGRTLLEYCRDRLTDPKTRCARIVELARQAASGLAAAHEAGIVHRDVKPSNMLVGDDGRLRIIDFGLARAATEETAGGSSAEETASSDAHRVTATGEVVGTPAYMAPEQDSASSSAREATTRSDQFAWALSFWEALFDTRPYAGRTRLELREAMQAGRIEPPPEGHRVPRRVRRVLERALVPWPAERWEDMEDVAAALARPSRKSIALGAGVVVALGVAWALVPDPSDRDLLCASTTRGIEAQWGPAEREALRAAVVGDGGAIGTETWSRLAPRLDAFVSSWTDARTEVCLAATQQSMATAEASIACLERRRRAFEDRIRLLTMAEASAAPRALQIAASLPKISDCTDPEWLQAQAEPLGDAELDASVIEAVGRIDEVDALVNLGRAEEAMPRIDELVAVAERMGYAPVVARALHVRGFAQDELGHDDAAIEDYRRAYFLALESSDYARAAESAAEVAYVFGDRLRRADDADEWLGHMGAALERAPATDTTLRARCEVRRATVLRRKGDRTAALAAVDAAVAGFTEAGGEHDVRIPSALVIAVDVHGELGDAEAARAVGDRALAIAQDALGPSHPMTSQIHGSLCSLALEHQDIDAARLHCRQAHAGALAAPERDSPTLAGTINNLGFLAVNEGELEKALSHFQEALALLEASGRGEHAYAAQTLQNIALCLEQLGRSEESLVAMDRSIEITERGSDPLATAIVLYNAGTVAHTKRSFDRATHYLERAVQAAGPEQRSHPVVIQAKSMLGAMYVDRGDAGRALPLLEDALQVFDAQPQMSPLSTAVTRVYLARALIDTGGDETRAVALARRAREDFAALDPPDPAGAAAVEELLRQHDR